MPDPPTLPVGETAALVGVGGSTPAGVPAVQRCQFVGWRATDCSTRIDPAAWGWLPDCWHPNSYGTSSQLGPSPFTVPGPQVTLVQARNNARVTVAGSLAMFSNAFFDAAVKVAATGKE